MNFYRNLSILSLILTLLYSLSVFVQIFTSLPETEIEYKNNNCLVEQISPEYGECHIKCFGKDDCKYLAHPYYNLTCVYTECLLKDKPLPNLLVKEYKQDARLSSGPVSICKNIKNNANTPSVLVIIKSATTALRESIRKSWLSTLRSKSSSKSIQLRYIFLVAKTTSLIDAQISDELLANEDIGLCPLTQNYTDSVQLLMCSLNLILNGCANMDYTLFLDANSFLNPFKFIDLLSKTKNVDAFAASSVKTNVPVVRNPKDAYFTLYDAWPHNSYPPILNEKFMLFNRLAIKRLAFAVPYLYFPSKDHILLSLSLCKLNIKATHQENAVSSDCNKEMPKNLKQKLISFCTKKDYQAVLKEISPE